MSGLAARGPAWLEQQIGLTVTTSSRLQGGTSGTAYRCVMADGSLVVVRSAPVADAEDRAGNEAARELMVLRLLGDSQIPVPAVLAAAPEDGLLATTFLPGETLVSADQLSPRVEGIADLALRIASVDVSQATVLPHWRSWVAPAAEPPPWGDAPLWAEALAEYRSRQAPLAEAAVLLHRDLHPGNILWQERAVAGVVDWVNACIGHPHAELGHCRWNLWCLVGRTAADRFLQHYLDRSDGSGYDRWWDLASALSFLPDPIRVGWEEVGRPDLTDSEVLVRTEAFLREALSS